MTRRKKKEEDVISTDWKMERKKKKKTVKNAKEIWQLLYEFRLLENSIHIDKCLKIILCSVNKFHGHKSFV